MIGLKRGDVMLCEHEKEWETEAERTIDRLQEILGDTAEGIEHVGSTSIKSIKAKPIIDIAIKVKSFEEILNLQPNLLANGFYYCKNANQESQLLFGCGSYYDKTGNEQTHFIHVVLDDSMDFINYVNFRDYMNAHAEKAKEYETIKINLMNKFQDDRNAYTLGKADFIKEILRKALVWSYLGKVINVKIDRPLGSVHPKHLDIIYPVNYGYIPDIIAGDGEALDVYILGIDKPIREITCKVISIIYREDDAEDKLVAAPDGMIFNVEEINSAVHFQEQYYKTKVEVLP